MNTLPGGNSEDDLTRRRRIRRRQRIKRDILEILGITLIAFMLSFAGLTLLSSSREGNLDSKTITMTSLSVAIIICYIAAVATLIPGESQDIRDRED